MLEQESKLKCSVCGNLWSEVGKNPIPTTTHAVTGAALWTSVWTCVSCQNVQSQSRTVEKRKHPEGKEQIECDDDHGRDVNETLEAKTFKMRRTINKQWTCKVCGQSFDKFALFKVHKSRHSAKNELAICDVCGKGFPTMYKVSIHRRIHDATTRWDCIICGRLFVKFVNLSKHMKKVHDEGLLCNVCGKTFSKEASLKTHMRLHPDKKQTWRCERCDVEFSSQDARDQHTCALVKTGNKWRWTCDVCGRSYLDRGRLRIHKTAHAGNLPWECNICDRVYAMMTSLKTHVHKKTLPFKCSICEKRFTTEKYARKHKLYVHTGGPLKCRACEKSYILWNDLKRHVRTHMNEDNQPGCRCGVCGEIFSEMNNLKQHMKIHSDQMPWQCPACKKTFTRRKVLSDHLVDEHIGELPWRCSVCGDSFGRIVILKAHMKKHAVKKKTIFSGKTLASSSNLKDNGLAHASVNEQPFNCKILEDAGLANARIYEQAFNLLPAGLGTDTTLSASSVAFSVEGVNCNISEDAGLAHAGVDDQPSNPLPATLGTTTILWASPVAFSIEGLAVNQQPSICNILGNDGLAHIQVDQQPFMHLPAGLGADSTIWPSPVVYRAETVPKNDVLAYVQVNQQPSKCKVTKNDGLPRIQDNQQSSIRKILENDTLAHIQVNQQSSIRKVTKNDGLAHIQINQQPSICKVTKNDGLAHIQVDQQPSIRKLAKNDGLAHIQVDQQSSICKILENDGLAHLQVDQQPFRHLPAGLGADSTIWPSPVAYRAETVPKNDGLAHVQVNQQPSKCKFLGNDALAHVHVDRQVFKCQMCCHGTFSVAKNGTQLSSRSKQTHWECEVCGMWLSSDISVAWHKEFHTGHRICMCDTCGRAFCRVKYLEEHRLEMHSRGKQWWMCDVCSDLYFDVSQVTSTHTVTNTESRQSYLLPDHNYNRTLPPLKSKIRTLMCKMTRKPNIGPT